MKQPIIWLLLFLWIPALAWVGEGSIMRERCPDILILTERGGQHESFTVRALDYLECLAEERGYRLTVINDASPVDSVFLSGFSLFLQLDFPPYTWSETAQKAFEEYVDQGRGGWIGFHHATLLGDFDGWPMWEWFSDFLGGIRFRNYIRELADGTVTVSDPVHPVMRGVAPGFVLPDDEWYVFDRSPGPNVRVLATVDEESYSPPSGIRMGDHPVVWSNENKAARNVYFLFGHSGKLFDSPDFVRMFTNAIEWAIASDNTTLSTNT